MDFPLIESMLKTNTELFNRAVEGIPEEQWLTTPRDGSNHLTWLAGHIVVTRANVPRLLGQSWSAPWEGLFKRGAQRVSPEQYPGPAEIQRAWKEVSGNLSNSGKCNGTHVEEACAGEITLSRWHDWRVDCFFVSS